MKKRRENYSKKKIDNKIKTVANMTPRERKIFREKKRIQKRKERIKENTINTQSEENKENTNNPRSSRKLEARLRKKILNLEKAIKESKSQTAKWKKNIIEQLKVKMMFYLLKIVQRKFGAKVKARF